jgi:prepilin-type N-terminal cleavage/methylation domain-containing protein
MFPKVDQKNLPSQVEKANSDKGKKGFSLFEVIIGIGLVGIAMLGLAQMFTYSVMNNSRSDRISNATYLAQQQIEALRNLTADELNTLTSGAIDEQIDINSDTTYDFRRVTQVQISGSSWSVRVLVFPPTEFNVDLSTIVQDPISHRVRADINTIISR